MNRVSPPHATGRIRDPAETVRRLEPHLASLGITRLARQTGLDRIGIPVFAAMRPNSLSLAVNQGKGVDEHAARASAAMEAAEFAVAERPGGDIAVTTASRLRAAREAVFEPTRLMPQGLALPDEENLHWLPGRQLHSGEPIWIALETARLDHTTEVFGGLSRSSNGLASGNDEDEAVLHALCELVERDAATLFALQSERVQAERLVDPARFASAVVDRLAERIRSSGFELRLFDITSDLGIPAMQAVLFEAGRPPRLQFDVAGGSGCHAVAAQAAIRAITEAAQTRITNISGARDDIDPRDYDLPLTPGLRHLLAGSPGTGRAAPPDLVPTSAAGPAAMLKAVLGRLRAAGIVDLPAVELGGARYGISVVRVFAPQLEDRPANRQWRPGPRAYRATLRLW